jgi:hypothetical protein
MWGKQYDTVCVFAREKDTFCVLTIRCIKFDRTVNYEFTPNARHDRGNVDAVTEAERGLKMTAGKEEKTSETEATSTEEEVSNKNDLTMAETERLLPPSVDFISQAGWDQVPKMLAIALAVHELIDEQVARIHQRARALLQSKHKKEIPDK